MPCRCRMITFALNLVGAFAHDHQRCVAEEAFGP
jgi:hypothetical protein